MRTDSENQQCFKSTLKISKWTKNQVCCEKFLTQQQQLTVINRSHKKVPKVISSSIYILDYIVSIFQFFNIKYLITQNISQFLLESQIYYINLKILKRRQDKVKTQFGLLSICHFLSHLSCFKQFKYHGSQVFYFSAYRRFLSIPKMKVVICGGGIIGCSVAYFLTKLGQVCKLVFQDF